LNDKTPAELAKANFKIHNWVDLVNHSKYKAGVIKTKEPRTLPDVTDNHVAETAFKIEDKELGGVSLLVSMPRGASETILSQRKSNGGKLIRIVKKAAKWNTGLLGKGNNLIYCSSNLLMCLK
jgi:hypothetical protein